MALLVLDLREENSHITSLYLQHDMEYNNLLLWIRAHMVWGITSVDAVRLSSVDILLYYHHDL
jgi:hypothetical protein